MKPWDVSGWLVDRLKELAYQGVSWPYLLSIAMTLLFYLKTDAVVRDAMLLSWGIALGNRGWKAWLLYKQNGGGSPPVPVPGGTPP